MTLLEFIEKAPAGKQVEFIYCTTGADLSPVPVPELSMTGTPDAFREFFTENDLLGLYPWCGEANDFEAAETEDLLWVRYIDFR